MSKRSVLIVDDEKDLLRLLELRISAAGYTVLTADNGKEAIRIARNDQPDLILLDIMMPGMGGGEVCEILKEDPNTKDIPIIFLTCLYTKKEEAEGGHTIKGNYFIAKPFDSNELISEIDSHIRQRP